jgi:hypothetical protein
VCVCVCVCGWDEGEVAVVTAVKVNTEYSVLTSHPR